MCDLLTAEEASEAVQLPECTAASNGVPVHTAAKHDWRIPAVSHLALPIFHLLMLPATATLS